MSRFIKLIILLMQGWKWNFVERDSWWWVPSRAYRDPPLDTLHYTTLHCSAHCTLNYTTIQYTALHYAGTHCTTPQCKAMKHSATRWPNKCVVLCSAHCTVHSAMKWSKEQCIGTKLTAAKTQTHTVRCKVHCNPLLDKLILYSAMQLFSLLTQSAQHTRPFNRKHCNAQLYMLQHATIQNIATKGVDTKHCVSMHPNCVGWQSNHQTAVWRSSSVCSISWPTF